MKVLFLNPLGALGGAEQGLLDLIVSLRRHDSGVQVSLLSLEDGPLLAETVRAGASARILALPRSLATLGESATDGSASSWMRSAAAGVSLASWLPRFALELRRAKPDILHSNGLKTHLLAALVRPSATHLIWHLHDFVSHRRITARLLPKLARRASLGIAVSECVRADARGVLAGLRIETVLNGVRTELFGPGAAPPVDLDCLARLPPAPVDVLRVGLVCTYARWKGQSLFIQAAALVRSPRVRFFLIGGPVYSTRGSQLTEQELRDQLRALGLEERFGLVPFQESMGSVYAALDVVVHGSTRPEPFGRTVAEAMAAGRPVIAARAGGVLEQLPAELAAWSFTPEREDELAASIERLVADTELRAALGRIALHHARSHLDSARLGPAMLRLYESVLRGSTLPGNDQRMNGRPPGDGTQAI